MGNSKKDNMFNAILKKENGKLIYQSEYAEKVYNEFVGSLEEGQLVEIFLDGNKDDGTLAQLAKIHKCIRILAQDIGYSYEDMKMEIKKKAGLCIKKRIGDEMYMICKSFGDASKDELSLTIQAIIEVGDFNGSNFR